MKRLLTGICVFFLMLAVTGCTQRISLFNGKNLEGWVPYLQDESIDPAAVWSVRDGALRCEGKPFGYLRTVDSFSNYTLSLEWRWPDIPTNSGVLLHTVGEDKLWPQSIEAQLKHLDAGDFVTIQHGTTITVNDVVHQPDEAFWKVVPKRLPTSEHLSGRWNRYRIVCRGGTINLYVNGVHQNSAINVSPSEGAICLQSEGSPIEFRNIYLVPLK